MSAQETYGIEATRPGDMVSNEELSRMSLQQEIRDSLERIYTALNQSSRNVNLTPLLRSDLDNAVRHALRVSKNLREIKKSLFPPAEKEETATNGTTKSDPLAPRVEQ